MTLFFTEGFVHCTDQGFEQVWHGGSQIPAKLEPFGDFVCRMLKEFPLTTWSRIFALSGHAEGRRQDVLCSVKDLADNLRGEVRLLVGLCANGEIDYERCVEVPGPDAQRALSWPPRLEPPYVAISVDPGWIDG